MSKNKNSEETSETIVQPGTTDVIVSGTPVSAPLSEAEQKKRDDENATRLATRGSATEAPVFDEPNMPKDNEVLRNQSGITVTSTSTGRGTEDDVQEEITTKGEETDYQISQEKDAALGTKSK